MDPGISLMLFGTVFAASYLGASRQLETAVKSKHKTVLNPDRRGSGMKPGPGVRDTENNLAYFATPLLRNRSNSISAYEAEATTSYHDISQALSDARGSPIDQVSILARYNREKDRALQNVPSDYDNGRSHFQVRRNEGIRSNRRLMETIADHPKFADASKWVPHTRSPPLPPSMGKSFWRPTAYMQPGWNHTRD